MKTLSDLHSYYERQVGKLEHIDSDINQLESEIANSEKLIKRLEKAHEIVKLVGGETQQQLQFHISDITSLALESVFTNPYKVVLDFVERRGKIECDILLERKGVRVKPKDSAGFGQVDVASFALRVAAWSMQTPRTRPTIIIDEPFKHMSQKFHEPAAQMVKELSDKLGIQFIICTHIQALADYADAEFKVKLRSGISHVTRIK